MFQNNKLPEVKKPEPAKPQKIYKNFILPINSEESVANESSSYDKLDKLL